MAATAPDLPTRFPCWCRAVYSWGGETEKDLGFMEGDLIECLNAGDGSWWVGRLRRDKRVMGSFPSNFVMVLEEGFQPASRAPSPMPEQQSSRAPSPQPQAKQKSSACRKPFQGYKTASTAVQRHKSADQLRNQSRQQSYDPQNPPSTVLWQQSPSRPGRSPSPMMQDLNSSPPPPPPPHRVAVADSRSRPASPLPPAHGARYRRTPSPDIASMHGHTPPMVRDAMDDVMSSLEDMTRVEQQERPASTFNPWSPEAFDALSRPSAGRTLARPKSALDFGMASESVSSRFNQGYQPERDSDAPPQLNNYVQRMESRLRRMQDERNNGSVETFESREDGPPAVPAKDVPWNNRPASSMAFARPNLKARKSAYELGRTSTYKSTTTNSSSGVQSNATNTSTATSMTGQSVFSAGGISATSAGSLARRSKLSLRRRPVTAGGAREEPKQSTWSTGASDSNSRSGARSAVGWENKGGFGENNGGLGGFSAPKQKRSGFFKKLFDGSKTVAASARSSIAVGSTTSSPTKTRFGAASMPNSYLSHHSDDAAKEMGLGGGNVDWVHVRRDINRSNTPGPVERQERADRCQMLDHPVISPIDELYETMEGEEDAHGHPVLEAFQLSNPSFTGVDKAARFITSLPPMITPSSLAQGYICRPHRSDVQRLRAIFTWTSERIAWDEDFDGEMDSRRVIQTKRGCSHEVAILVYEMCSAIGIHSEIIRGYLKSPGEDVDLDASINRPNHYWNAVMVDHEWRMLDCSLASHTNPRRPLYTSMSSAVAEPFYFLTRPIELCYTHVPTDPQQQHILPPIAHDVLLALPCALPPYFRQKSQLYNYDTSLVRLEGLELASVTLNVSPDIEVVAEVESRSYLRDSDGDVYENADAVVRKRALAQASWYSPPSSSGGATDMVSKRYTIKALLPTEETSGILKIYAGKRGLMHSSKDIPHPLALVLPLFHTGDNPAYEFLTRHPTPHAMRQDIYVIQPQCRRLAIGETFVFSVRQHTASASNESPDANSNTNSIMSARPVSPNPFARPASAMSMMSMSVAGSASNSNSGSQSSDPNTTVGTSHGVRIRDKAAKLAVQSPAGKILKLNRKAEHAQTTVERGGGGESDGWAVQGSVWETVVKVQERGVWRGLVLADRSARWCVWGEWECL